MAKRKKQTERLLKVSGLSLKVAGSYVKQRFSEFFTEAEKVMPARMATHLRNAQLIAETVGEMKGTIMKLGQMMSLNAEIFPKEFTSVLASLQQEAPAVDFAKVKPQIEEGLGRPLNEMFTDVDPHPIAAASIGQVHRARLPNGREVVIKVQYPGVEEDVEGDLKNIRLLFKTLKPLGRGFDLTHMMGELRRRMLEELDYQNEIKNMERFRDIFAEMPQVVLPVALPEWSAKTILTMEYIPGTPLRTFAENETSGTKRNRLGEHLMQFYLHQLYGHGMLHADPNPGNFAVGANEELIVYDFGCVKKFPKVFMDVYRQVIRQYMQGERDHIAAGVEKLGIQYLGEEPLDHDFYEEFAEIFMEPFLTEPYSFGNADLQAKVMEKAKLYLQEVTNFRPPKHILFHNRVLIGAYNNLRALRATGYWRSILRDYLV